ncbi:MAG: ABC transporter permease, partial [Acidobacteria bacterium]|nr:ABC transporter permease [Acidobacteriota bacterium]
MRKFLAVVKHEYRKVVLKWSFLIGTLLLPFLAACFAIVPAVIFSIKGDPTRIAVIDPTDRILPRLKENLSAAKMSAKARRAGAEAFENMGESQEQRMKRNVEMFAESFIFVDYPYDANRTAAIRHDLNNKILNDEIEAYLIVPENPDSPVAIYEFRSQRAGDFITNDTFKDALNDAVRSQRLAEANISEDRLEELSTAVKLDVKGVDESGEEKDSSGLMIASFAIGLMIYLTLT